MAHRSCSLELYLEFAFSNETYWERSTLGTGGAQCPLHGGPINANKTRRCARNKIVSCVQALWDQRNHDAIPTPCQSITLHVNIASGESLLAFIAELMFEEKGQPTHGRILGRVTARIFGDKGCGWNKNKEVYIPLGWVTLDLDERKIFSAPFEVEFDVPQLPPLPEPETDPDPMPIGPGNPFGDMTFR